MYRKIVNYLNTHRDRQRIAIALAKGSAMLQLRNIDLKRPTTWEFSGFSQNGEDGILNVLRSQLTDPNKYFIEIGAADGIDNNSAWLTIVEKYRGLMIEADEELVFRARRMVGHYSLGLDIVQMFVEPNNVDKIREMSLVAEPDILSLDIDGVDYYVAEALFNCGFRPKVFVVEYNSVFGPDSTSTIEYRSGFSYTEAHDTHLYYGVSISGWRKFFNRHGYQFVTVESNGVNAFFVDPGAFRDDFLEKIEPLSFAENQLQLKKFRAGHQKQYEKISDMRFVEI